MAIESNFAKKTIKLTFVSFLSQFIPLLFYPIFTRVYTPEVFGLSSTYLTLIPIIIIISTGTFEYAILNSNNEEDSLNIISYILRRSLIVLTIFQVVAIIFGDFICDLFKQPDLKSWIIFIPLTVFFSILTIIFNEWSILINNFRQLGSLKLINSTSTSISKFLFGFFKASSNGMIFGEIIGRFISALYSLVVLNKFGFTLKKVLAGFKSYKLVAIKHRGLGSWTMSEQLISNLGGALPNIMIGIYFSNKDLGYFALSGSLLTAPITVITISIRDVFRNKVSENFKTFGNSKSLYIKILKKVVLIGLVSFTFLYFILPTLVVYGLGSNWITVSKFAMIQIPMFLLSFISMSLSGVLIIANKLKQSFYWQIYYTIITLVSLIIGILFFKSIETTLLCLVVGRCSAYIIYIYLSYNASKG